MKLSDRIKSVGPHEKVPESFIEKWGGEWGCPCRDQNGVLLGYIESAPSIRPETEKEKKLADEMWEEAMGTFMAF